MSEALGKIRAALKGHDLFGAEAIELRPGAVVLVVLKWSPTTCADDIGAAQRTWVTVAEALQAEGVRAVACCVPHGFGLDVIEVADAPPARVPWVGDADRAMVDQFRVALANRSGETAVELPEPPEAREP